MSSAIVIEERRLLRRVAGVGDCQFAAPSAAAEFRLVHRYWDRPHFISSRGYVDELVSACLREPTLSAAEVSRLPARSRTSLRLAALEACGAGSDYRRLRSSSLSVDERAYAAMRWRCERLGRDLAKRLAKSIQGLLHQTLRSPLADRSATRLVARTQRQTRGLERYEKLLASIRSAGFGDRRVLGWTRQGSLVGKLFQPGGGLLAGSSAARFATPLTAASFPETRTPLGKTRTLLPTVASAQGSGVVEVLGSRLSQNARALQESTVPVRSLSRLLGVDKRFAVARLDYGQLRLPVLRDVERLAGIDKRITSTGPDIAGLRIAGLIRDNRFAALLGARGRLDSFAGIRRWLGRMHETFERVSQDVSPPWAPH